MKFEKYQSKIKDTASYGPSQKVILPVMWLCEEAGEVMHEIREVVKNPSDSYNLEHIAEELGDTLVAMACLCNDLELDLDVIAIASIKKLASKVEEQGK